MTTAENRLGGGQRSVVVPPPPRGALTRGDALLAGARGVGAEI